MQKIHLITMNYEAAIKREPSAVGGLSGVSRDAGHEGVVE
jgi:hypothetical protein